MMSYQNGKVERGFNLWRNWGEIHRVWIRWRQGKCASNLDWRTAPGGGETMGMEVSCFPWGIFLIRFFGPIFVGPEPTLLCLYIYVFCWFLILSWIWMDLEDSDGVSQAETRPVDTPEGFANWWLVEDTWNYVYWVWAGFDHIKPFAHFFLKTIIYVTKKFPTKNSTLSN